MQGVAVAELSQDSNSVQHQASPFVDTAPETQLVSGAETRQKRPSTLALAIARPRTAVDILDAVGARFGVTWKELLSKDRTAHIVTARHVAAWLMRQAGMSYPAIGRTLGRRDHSTAMHSVARIEAERGKNPEVAAELDAMARDRTLPDRAPMYSASHDAEEMIAAKPDRDEAVRQSMAPAREDWL